MANQHRREEDISLPHGLPLLWARPAMITGGNSGRPFGHSHSLPRLLRYSSLSLSRCSFYLHEFLSFSLSVLKIKPTTNLEHRKRELRLPHMLAEKNQGMLKCRGQASFVVKCRHCQWVRHVTKPWGDAVSPPFSNQPTCGFGCKSVPCGLLVVMVASVCNESGQISKYSFWDRLSKLWLWI